MTNSTVSHFDYGKLKPEIHPNREAAGAAAARAAADALKKLAGTRESIGVIFATGASQIATLEALPEIEGVPWEKIRGFHMDEYAGRPEDHPASFRKYLREKLTSRVGMRSFLEVDGTAPDPTAQCKYYAEQLRAADPQ
jgi:glucosamine-6-phosphate deaminase